MLTNISDYIFSILKYKILTYISDITNLSRITNFELLNLIFLKLFQKQVKFINNIYNFYCKKEKKIHMLLKINFAVVNEIKC